MEREMDRSVPTSAEVGIYTGEGAAVGTARQASFCEGVPPVRIPSGWASSTVSKKAQGRRGARLACCILAVCLAVSFLPSVWAVVREADGRLTWRQMGTSVCEALLTQGLPPVNGSLLGLGADQRFPGQVWDTAVEGLPTEPETTGAVAPPIVEPDGTPIVSLDMSEWSRGPTHLTSAVDCDPPEVSDHPEALPKGTAVLIIHSHPYETYGDGGTTAVRGEHGWAVDIPGDGAIPANGVVALGERLTLLLRLRGVEVIHVALPDGDVPSHMDTYERTRATVAELLLVHARIGLVVDLRRGAEQLPDGSLLRTCGTYGGETVAQVKVSVAALREGYAWHRDLAVGVSLRRRMFETEATLSRPVHLSPSEGLVADGQAVFLTVEVGTAGNTFEEALPVLTPLADALTEILT